LCRDFVSPLQPVPSQRRVPTPSLCLTNPYPCATGSACMRSLTILGPVSLSAFQLLQALAPTVPLLLLLAALPTFVRFILFPVPLVNMPLPLVFSSTSSPRCRPRFCNCLSHTPPLKRNCSLCSCFCTRSVSPTAVFVPFLPRSDSILLDSLLPRWVSPPPCRGHMERG